MEIWKDIPWYEWKYQVSTFGRVNRLPKQIIRNNWRIQTFSERVLKISKDAYWYGQISLAHCWMVEKHKPHRLVAIAFIWDIPKWKQINHIDWNKFNNNINNLEIVTPSENMIHSYKVLKRVPKGAVINNKKKVVAYYIERKSQKQDLKIIGKYKEFESLKQASEKLNIISSSISACLNWKQKTAWGFIWKYI